MSKTPPSPEPKQPAKIKRLQIGVNVLIQLLLVVIMVAAANYLGFKYYKRWDYSRNQKHALSDKTRQLLASIKDPVKIFVIIPKEGFPLFTELEGLLKEYQYAGRPNITVEYVDTYKNLNRTSELFAKYQFGENESLVIVDCNGHSKFISTNDLAEWDRSMEAFGQPPKAITFLGEQKLSSTLLEVTESRRPKVYYAEGHGEPGIDKDSTMELFKAFVERDNLLLEGLNLQSVDQMPEDTGALIICGPTHDFLPREMEILQAYWNKGGRIMVLLDPAASTVQLREFISKNGILAQDNRIIRTVAIKQMGDLIGIVKDVAAEFLPGSPITSKLKGVSGLFSGGSQSLLLDPKLSQSQNMQLIPLVKALPEFWGESRYLNMEAEGVYRNEGEDATGELIMAASVEKGGVADERVKVASSRMIVAGTYRFLTDSALVESDLNFTMAGLNWLLNREQLIGIAPKEMKTFTLKLDERQLGTISWLAMVIMPGLAALFGLGIWWSRRR